ncbi:hypothetical protein PIB30_054468 [Stylosanthes scabra]|uniref:RRM domain-containing protein n=1 Tax=Stylosanthes scabra TaxID=79078 RepID=A0ABU6WLJ4_9FABA|nr:hypothetical protein [Stylosanthes scabra]
MGAWAPGHDSGRLGVQLFYCNFLRVVPGSNQLSSIDIYIPNRRPGRKLFNAIGSDHLEFCSSRYSQFSEQRNENLRGDYQQGRRWNERNSYTVFVDKLPTNTTKQWLAKVFNGVGKVVDTFLSIKKRATNPLRLAFVRFATRREAVRAVEQYDGWLIWGKRIKVAESKYKREWTIETEIKQKENKDAEERVRNEGRLKASERRDSKRSYKDVLETGWRDAEVVEMNKENEMQIFGSSKTTYRAVTKCLRSLKGRLLGKP